MKPRVFLASITSNKEISSGIFHMTLHCADLAREAAPGQFIMLQMNEHMEPLLRRPFSLCGVGKESVEILFKVIGKGTAIMAGWMPGQIVNFIGPLGRGFWLPEKIAEVYLVAGGIGIAPLLFLLNTIKNIKSIADIKIFMGAKTEQDALMLEGFAPLGADLFIATESGTKGYHGLVTDLFLKHFFERGKQDLSQTCLFGCGPFPMVKVLAETARSQKFQCQLSLESRMACGVGACMGCVVATKPALDNGVAESALKKNHSYQYQRVCVEGPVFDSREIRWDAPPFSSK